jgi:hypothetical protein
LKACGFFYAHRVFYFISDSYFSNLLPSMISNKGITTKPFKTGIVFAKYKRVVTTQVHGSGVHGWRVMKIESRLAGKILRPGKWHAN